MTEKAKETHKPQEKKPTKEELEQAVIIVNDAIRAQEEEYRKIASDVDQDPTVLEGITDKGYNCSIMVDPKDVADIFLRWNYATYFVLGEDAPDEMWREIGEFYGIRTACGVEM